MNAPATLKNIQNWFASLITSCIDSESKMNPVTPFGTSLEEEAKLHVVSSPFLKPHERIQIYCQQYWWRLLSTLHEAFPLVTRLFGYYGFNQSIGIPYLSINLSKHWSLSTLGDALPEWISTHYTGADQELVYHSARLDWAFNMSFIAKQLPAINPAFLADESKMLSLKLILQPSIFLFEFPYNLVQYRCDFLKKDPEYWTHSDFPPLHKGKFYFIVYRNLKNDVHFKELSEIEWKLLGLFASGNTIEEVCTWLEQQNEIFYEQAAQHLHLWFQEWTARQWLTSYEC